MDITAHSYTLLININFLIFNNNNLIIINSLLSSLKNSCCGLFGILGISTRSTKIQFQPSSLKSKEHSQHVALEFAETFLNYTFILAQETNTVCRKNRMNPILILTTLF